MTPKRHSAFFLVIVLILQSTSSLAQQEQPQPPPAPTPDDIYVNGKLYPSPKIYQDYLPNIAIVDGRPSFAFESEGPQRSQHVCTEKNAKREAGKDQLAVDFDTKTKASYPDANEREYASGLIMDATNPSQPTFRLSPITAGDTWKEAIAAGKDAPEVHFRIGALAMYERVVGIIHIHPAKNDPSPEENKLPSRADWSVYSVLVANKISVAPEYAFSSYVVGPDGKIREYRQDARYPTTPTSGINNRC